jgi:TPR repeat protein
MQLEGRWRSGAVGLSLGLALAFCPTRSRAQACQEPQRASAGHCCAADQMWDQRYGRCSDDARPRCIAGEYSACLTAGDHYAATGRPADLLQASAYYRQACDHGAAAGCSALGFLELQRPEPERALARATTWFTRACDGQHLRGCTALAELYLSGRATPRQDEALSLLQRACEAGEPRACARLSLLIAATEPANACRLAERAMQANDAIGQLSWGRLQRDGRCGKPDGAAAYRFFELACAAAEGEACFELAQLQRAGRGPSKQPELIRPHLKLACSQGHAAACLQLADDFQQGTTGPQDPSLARLHLSQGCKLEDAAACARLGTLLDASPAVDSEAARIAWQTACKSGAPRDCFGFAEHLLDHPTSREDMPLATQLLAAACDKDYMQACALLADVHGWTGAQTQHGAEATRDFQAAQARASQACQLGSADSCVKAALIELNTDPNALARARSALEHACQLGTQLGCAYLKQGPYPFPYASRAALPARFVLGSVSSTPQRERPPTAAPATAKPASTPPVSVAVVPERALSQHSSLLQAEFLFAATSQAKLGLAVWDVHAELAPGFAFVARVPMYSAWLRVTGPTDVEHQPAFGFGNPELGVTRSIAQRAYHLGVMLPLAYVPESAEGSELGSEASRLAGATRQALEAAADGGRLDDGYLWARNAAGVVASLADEAVLGRWVLGAGATLAALIPVYARANAELFGSGRVYFGLRVGKPWKFSLAAVGSGWSDAEQLRLAFEPAVEYAADGGGRVLLGLELSVLQSGVSALGASPWVGIRLRVEP